MGVYIGTRRTPSFRQSLILAPDLGPMGTPNFSSKRMNQGEEIQVHRNQTLRRGFEPQQGLRHDCKGPRVSATPATRK